MNLWRSGIILRPTVTNCWWTRRRLLIWVANFLFFLFLSLDEEILQNVRAPAHASHYMSGSSLIRCAGCRSQCSTPLLRLVAGSKVTCAKHSLRPSLPNCTPARSRQLSYAVCPSLKRNQPDDGWKNWIRHHKHLLNLFTSNPSLVAVEWKRFISNCIHEQIARAHAELVHRRSSGLFIKVCRNRILLSYRKLCNRNVIKMEDFLFRKIELICFDNVSN